MNKDLFGKEILKDILLRDKFIEPPFSILDSKSGSWRKRVKKWKQLGILNEVSRSNKNKSNGFDRIAKMNEKINGSSSGMLKDGVSVFDPALCEVLYHWFCPDGGTILDPFSGGSVRGIVANKLGFDYTGIDIREEQIQSNYEQGKEILGDKCPKWICNDSNVELDLFDKSFDFVFSCPPYVDLEVYSDLEGDISNKPYKDFLELYESIILKSCKLLKSGGYACFVVGEVRDKNGYYIGFVPDTIKAFEKAGVKFYNECIYLNGLAGACLTAGYIMNISKKVKKVHQNVLIFKKVK
jgi:DNA modification methylase